MTAIVLTISTITRIYLDGETITNNPRLSGRLVTASLIYLDSQIQIDIDGDGELTVYGYENEYSQVLLNIINNAREAMLDNKVPTPLLRITYGKEDKDAVLRIADNGGGIPDAIKEKIFDPYFTTKGSRSGTGIGLYMSKTIIEKNMNGTIMAYNKDGGAVFEIRVAAQSKS